MINNIFNFITGILLFFFGINTLNCVLNKNNNNYIKKFINYHHTPIKGLLLGMISTIITQSSSFITVILTTLVDNNIYTLYESSSIIMGSNIGTCSSCFFIVFLLASNINIFDSSVLVGVLSIASLFFLFRKKKKWETLFIGLTLILLSMNIMNASTTFITNLKKFSLILKFMENPLFGLLLGTILTAILQSSSLVTGILCSLSIKTPISYLSSINIILGSNIGTCSTVILASLNGSKNAKKVSLFHLLFNMLGSFVFLILIYLLNYIFHFNFLNDAIKPLDIAFIHLTFNVITTIIFLPLSKKLVKLCDYLIK